jgi:3'-5' exoribonuclease
VQRIAINQLQEGDILNQVFVLQDKVLGTTSTNKQFLRAECLDATGKIHCRMWNISRDVYDKIKSPGFVQLKGRIELYQGHLQLIAESIVPVENPEKINRADFLRATGKNVPDMLRRLEEILSTIKDADLKALVDSFLQDKPFMDKFITSPAAASLHHAWLGGLLEHTLSVLELAMVICPRYPDINQDLVLAGLFFHDIGKTEELSSQFGFEYTDTGRLIGHVVLGAMWIHKRASEVSAKLGRPLAPRVLMVLEHLILSHHGDPEFGAAVPPKTPEAVIINLIDNLDAKVQMVLDAVSDPTAEGDWTDFKKVFGSPIYRPVLR